MVEQEATKLKPGVCIPWEEKRKEYAEIMGDEELVRKIYESTDILAYLFIWACLIQF
jgi:hypothetical protein